MCVKVWAHREASRRDTQERPQGHKAHTRVFAQSAQKRAGRPSRLSLWPERPQRHAHRVSRPLPRPATRPDFAFSTPGTRAGPRGARKTPNTQKRGAAISSLTLAQTNPATRPPRSLTPSASRHAARFCLGPPAPTARPRNRKTHKSCFFAFTVSPAPPRAPRPKKIAPATLPHRPTAGAHQRTPRPPCATPSGGGARKRKQHPQNACWARLVTSSWAGVGQYLDRRTSSSSQG
jgi:hypothetical protein